MNKKLVSRCWTTNLINVERNKSTFTFDISMIKYNVSEAEIELILYKITNLQQL
ncbi:hypothetical protein ACLHDG_04525 [Sulfurovum sp. CS9]|uniref:hypothetical protein n=1 Tax=Sulfurovum sp. CS9 TaxID=3391146 RepID=UPI0039EA44E5